MINTYINTINLNILNSPIFGNRKGYCKAVKTAPHTSRSVRGVVFWLAIYFLLPNFLSIYIFSINSFKYQIKYHWEWIYQQSIIENFLSSDIIENILSYSRIESGKYELINKNFNIAEAIKKAIPAIFFFTVSFLAHKLNKRLIFEKNISIIIEKNKLMPKIIQKGFSLNSKPLSNCRIILEGIGD